MLNIFNPSCYGPLQIIVNNYYADEDKYDLVKDCKNTGKWDKLYIEIIWTLIFKQYPGVNSESNKDDSSMLSRLLEAYPNLSYNTQS
jgi:hypothetical protein